MFGRLLVSSIAVLLAAVAVSGSALVEPTVISSVSSNWAATLHVQPNRWTESSGYVSLTTRQYCYNSVCSFGGPTIRVKPGDSFNLTLVVRAASRHEFVSLQTNDRCHVRVQQNDLGPESGSSFVMNTMHQPNTTNIHTHGLHISPNVDSIFVSVAPGQSHTYNYVIPSDHAPGIHWYHSHRHGNSALLVMGGLFGALIVDPIPAHNIPASYTAMTKTVMVFSHVKINPSLIQGVVSQGCGFSDHCDVGLQPGCVAGSGASPFAPFREYDYQELSNYCGGQLDVDAVFGNVNNVQDFYLVNSQFNPTLTLAPGEKRVLQMVHAGGDSVLAVRAPQQPNSGCTLSLIAQDGIFYRTPIDRTTSGWKMVTAVRMEMVLSCTNAGTYTFTAQFGDTTQYTQTLFTVTVTGSAVSPAAVTAAELGAIVRPSYLSDLRSAYVDYRNTWAIEFSQGGRDLQQCGFWLGSGSNCSHVWRGVNPSRTDTYCPFEQFAGQKGGDGSNGPGKTTSATYKYVTTLGQANEWKIYGLGQDAHTLHIHVNHFQIVAYTPLIATDPTVISDWFQIGEWYDTVPAWDGELTIRFMPSDFAGETVVHCHFLRHEDLGMMETYYVCDGTAGSCPTGTVPHRNTTGGSTNGGGGGTGTSQYGAASHSAAFSVLMLAGTIVSTVLAIL